MEHKLKRLLLLLASVATVATVGASVAPVTYSASAATHHKKHHKKVKKHKKAKKHASTSSQSSTSNSDKAYKDYKNQLNNDINSYNEIVDGFATYTLANGGSNDAYKVDINNGNTSYSNGNYTDMSNSLNDVVKDMNTNNDAYDNNESGNNGIENLQSSADHLYLLFRDRFSSDENNTLDQLRDTIDKNQIQDNSNATYVSNQWTNVKNFFTELSKALPTLNKY